MEIAYIDVKELKKIIPMGIGTIYNLIKKDKIPSYKVGGKRLFDRDEIMKWIKSHREGG